MNHLEHLFSPIKIRGMELANRAVMPPMFTKMGNQDGTVSEAQLAYIKRRAKGRPGLVITEIACVHPSGLLGPSHIGAYDDRFIPSLKKWADAIHSENCKAAVQLHHAGRESLDLLTKGQAIGPSALPSPAYLMSPREMTLDEIHENIEAFGAAAARAKEAGFDAVEIHGAHGYLLSQFLSGLSNKRTDEYGGDFVQRARFTIEVLQAIRSSVGENYPVLLRVSVEEVMPDGYTAEDIVKVIPLFVSAGADVIHASVGGYGSTEKVGCAPPEYEPGFNAWRAKKLKEVTVAPVIAVGRFNDPAIADEFIARGDADLIAFGRQSLADPDYLIKARENRSGEIKKCIACNQGCIERIALEPDTMIRCAINPETGQELIYPKGPAETKKKVWIIGAGPAGLTAAYEATRLGHDVNLFEREEKAGGQIRFASEAPHKKGYEDWITRFISQVEGLGVTIRTSTAVTEKMVREGNPDVVILASGAKPTVPALPGIDLPMVTGALEVLSGQVSAGENVLVVGGGLIGLETADFLTAKGSRVTVIEVLADPPVMELTNHGHMLYKRLKEGHCRLLFGAELARIEDNRVVVALEGNEEMISPLDQVVLATGMTSRAELEGVLKTMGIRHFVVGDAAFPRRIIEATEEGARAAWEI